MGVVTKIINNSDILFFYQANGDNKGLITLISVSK